MEHRIYKFSELKLNLASGELCSGTATVRFQEKSVFLPTVLPHRHPQTLGDAGYVRSPMLESFVSRVDDLIGRVTGSGASR